MFKKILIANRGEIAVRVIRACREMGIIPAVVFSEADRKALHVRLAEEAYYIGESEPSQSYLNIDKIIAVAKKCKAEAIHPGYGFLAENPELVRRCEQEGLVFVGPSSEPMEIMGRKTASRQRMTEAGVPVIPGTLEAIKNEDDLRQQASKIGFPLLLKAVAGGGGKGLRLVRKKEELLSSWGLARSEAESSFNDAAVYIEKYIEEPHHIEIQILADHFGHIIYLGERECSIQRKYQKLLEETPSPFIDDKLRRRIMKSAQEAAQAIGYQSLGTFDFLVDDRKKFYFMEANTRIQVEHPITDMIYGIDLIKEQIKIAAGQKLSFPSELKPQGHSLECRINAEDSESFIPSPGKIDFLVLPGGEGIRVDSAAYCGWNIPADYDSLVAKISAWAPSRETAIKKMLTALEMTTIVGIKTNIPLHLNILTNSDFIKGNYDIHFMEKLLNSKKKSNKFKA